MNPRFPIDDVNNNCDEREPNKKGNDWVMFLIRWWFLFWAFVMVTWIGARNGLKGPVIHCMNEVLGEAAALNASNADAHEWKVSNIADRLETCSKYMEENMPPNCDLRYWSYFMRSIEVLRSIEYALMRVPEGNSVRQWFFMDSCKKPVNLTKPTPEHECNETTAYRDCLKRYAQTQRTGRVAGAQFDQSDLYGVSLYGGVPFLKQFVSSVKLNMSRAFQNVTCERDCFGQQNGKTSQSWGSSILLTLQSLGWCALLSFILSSLYSIFMKIVNVSSEALRIKFYSFVWQIRSICHKRKSEYNYIRGTTDIAGREDPEGGEPIQMQEL